MPTHQDTPSRPRRQWVYIYALLDPFTDAIRYIGKSTRPLQRLANHCNDRSQCHRTHWIQSCIANGRRPVLRILARYFPDSPWQEAEKMWIAYGLECGWPLTNGTLGGDGVEGLSKESRERIAIAWKGRKHSEEAKKKIGAASRGRKHTEAYKQMMREKMQARVFSQEHRQRLSETQHRRLPEDIGNRIREMLASGWRSIDIARELGVHRMTVSRIKNNRKN